MNHLANIRAQHDYNRKQVLWLTGMTDEELSSFQLETGMDWLKRYTLEERHILDEVMRKPMIWKWWMLQWNIRDDRHFLHCLYHVPANEANARYRQMHQAIFIPATPSYVLLEDSYARAINLLHDDLKNQE